MWLKTKQKTTNIQTNILANSAQCICDYHVQGQCQSTVPGLGVNTEARLVDPYCKLFTFRGINACIARGAGHPALV